MSRTTHDRDLDHHGTESAGIIALAAAIERYAIGETLDDVLSDIVARLVAVENLSGIYSLSADSILMATASGSFSADLIAMATASGSFYADAVAS